MGNTSPWAATNRRATLLSLDKLQATSFKQQATSDKLRQHVNYAPDTGMILWSRAARELVSMIRCKPCEACIRGEAGSSSQQQKGKYDTNRQTKRHRRVLQRPHQDGHHPTPSGGEDLVPAHGHSGCSARRSSRRRTGRKNQTRRVREVEAFQKRRLTHPRINLNTAPVLLGPSSCIPSRSNKPQASSAKLLKVQATSFKPQAASVKLQAASCKLLYLVASIKFHEARSEVLY